MKPTVVTLHEAQAAWADRPRFYLPTERGGWSPVSWGEVERAVRDIALFLDGEGLPSEASVAIYAPNRIEWLYAGLGAQAAGGVMVPIYPSSTAEQVGYMLSHAEAFAVFVDGQALLDRLLASGGLGTVRRIVLFDGSLDVEGARQRASALGADVPADIGSRVVTLDEARSSVEGGGSRYEALLSNIDRDRRCLMLYTSGTTGHPKAVPLTYDNVNSSSEDWIEVLGSLIPEDPIDLFWLPMSHIFGWGEACLGFELGFTSYLSTPKQVMEHVLDVRPSVFMSVPAYWEKLAAGAMHEADPEARRARLLRDTGGRLRFCLSGGAGLDRAVKEQFEEAGLLIIEGYGLTEASPTLTMNRPSAYRFDSVGLPFPRIELRLAEDGEILARGPSIFGGYHKDEEATRLAFTKDGFLKTGDLGRFTEDGFLQIIGRKKEILVTAGGKNIPPANIELRFAGDNLIDHVVVYGDAKKYLVAGIWLNAEAAAGQSPERIAAEVERRVGQINETLAHHETIKKYRIMDPALTVEGGLLTPTLKVKRKKVYEAFHEAFEAMYK